MAAIHSYKVQTTRAILGRLHMLLHSLAILAIFYYRFISFYDTTTKLGPISSTLLVTAELILTFVWGLSQSFRWRPVLRDVSGWESMKTEDLPGLDVFICTADPTKEPVLEVMNSVISAMALDYPSDKLAVYLSDDAGSPLTREAIKEATKFAKLWLPFCKKYSIKRRSPHAFFTFFSNEQSFFWSEEFKADELVVKSKYECLKHYVENASQDNSKCAKVDDRAPYVEIIYDNKWNGEGEVKMPLVVYVSREKRPDRPHKFKAGALNALLRVSGLLSNGQYILVLDCDMYCNDPTSARQSMCFHLDQNIAPTLAFVQYPQIFYNTSKNDIYDGQARSAYKTKWQGMDGLKGPVLTGTGYYLKRKALYGEPPNQEDEFTIQGEPQEVFGYSKKFISSLCKDSKQKGTLIHDWTIEELLGEAKILTSCSYESNTQWGKKIGYSYECLLESTFTGYLLHCKGWNSVYLYPKIPCFLGCTTIDMKDAMVQLMKWTSGLLGVGISKYSPLTYALSRMSILQSMCYGYFTFSALVGVFCVIYGVLLPLYLLKGIPIFPKVSDPWFWPFAIVFVSSHLQHLYEVLSSDESVKTWWNEMRIWIIKAVSACLFGFVDALMKKIGIQKASFRLTNKVVDKEKMDKYEKGKFDFQGAAVFMIPLVILVSLNLVSFMVGLKRVMGSWEVDQWVWRLHWRRRLYDWELEDLERLNLHIEQHPPIQHQEDSISWLGSTESRFPIREIMAKMYANSEPLIPQTVSSYIWSIKAPPRAHLTIWLASLRKLKTGDWLVSKGGLDPSLASCPFCLGELETNSHILFSCPFSWRVWMRALQWWGISGVFPNDCVSFILAWRHLAPRKRRGDLWKLALGCILWSIWFERNKAKFDGKVPDLAHFLYTLQIRINLWGKELLGIEMVPA